eukprot:TRINITY_DN3782_c2_g1_i1.p1 TRINITY_DN3782_c2_g1~~TRINITY_DN3782_c2_g1_i1.p1  ORF type:complete len:245 (+),score=39.34 TRINITY_DN3782_c2_g1_i1:92-826(+)
MTLASRYLRFIVFAPLVIEFFTSAAENNVDPIDDALHRDDACNAASRNDAGEELCSLQLLQAKANKAVTAINERANHSDADDKMEVAEGSHLGWRGVRETLSTCIWGSCSSAMGPTVCLHFRCVCKSGYFYDRGQHPATCRPEKEVLRTRETGGMCYLWSCSKSRGPVECAGHRCLCKKGYHAVNGVCKPGSVAKPKNTGSVARQQVNQDSNTWSDARQQESQWERYFRPPSEGPGEGLPPGPE